MDFTLLVSSETLSYSISSYPSLSLLPAYLCTCWVILLPLISFSRCQASLPGCLASKLPCCPLSWHKPRCLCLVINVLPLLSSSCPWRSMIPPACMWCKGALTWAGRQISSKTEDLSSCQDAHLPGGSANKPEQTKGTQGTSGRASVSMLWSMVNGVDCPQTASVKAFLIRWIHDSLHCSVFLMCTVQQCPSSAPEVAAFH